MRKAIANTVTVHYTVMPRTLHSDLLMELPTRV